MNPFVQRTNDPFKWFLASLLMAVCLTLVAEDSAHPNVIFGFVGIAVMSMFYFLHDWLLPRK